jgi:hypothetical protein
VQHYTNELTNSFVENGVLQITAIKEKLHQSRCYQRLHLCQIKFKICFLPMVEIDIRAKNTYPTRHMASIMVVRKKILPSQEAMFAATNGTTPWPACGEN